MVRSTCLCLNFKNYCVHKASCPLLKTSTVLYSPYIFVPHDHPRAFSLRHSSERREAVSISVPPPACAIRNTHGSVHNLPTRLRFSGGLTVTAVGHDTERLGHAKRQRCVGVATHNNTDGQQLQRRDGPLAWLFTPPSAAGQPYPCPAQPGSFVS